MLNNLPLNSQVFAGNQVLGKNLSKVVTNSCLECTAL
jgi:hypothetical protein